MKLTGKMKSLLFIALTGLNMTAHAEDEVPFKEGESIAVPRRHTYTAGQVKEAIIEAAEHYKWRVESETPGTVRIKLDERSDGVVLVVDVAYDATSYSFKYVSSEGLKYKSAAEKTGSPYAKNPNSNTVSKDYEISGPSIDSRYVRWTKNLKKAINRELKLTR
jgi:hypothetical protein